MPRPARRRARHQVVIQLMPGAEPWVRIEATGGDFKLPAMVTVLELWELLEGGYRGKPKATGEPSVRMDVSQWVELHARGTRSGTDPAGPQLG